MDIVVEGRGEKSYKPNQIDVTFDFRVCARTYEQALENSSKSVVEYISELEKLGFAKDDIKTRNMRVSENSVYDEKTRSYKKDGFVYSQNASLKFDYDTSKLAALAEITSKVNNAPRYNARFTIKQDKLVEEEVLALAYKDAEFQAEALAKASGKKLKECLKVSFQPFDQALVSSSRYDGVYESEMCKASSSARDNIQNILVPEDVEVGTSVYCLWLAE